MSNAVTLAAVVAAVVGLSACAARDGGAAHHAPRRGSAIEPPPRVPRGVATPRWTRPAALSERSPYALHVDARGRAFVLVVNGAWQLLREDADGRMRVVQAQHRLMRGVRDAEADFGLDRHGRPVIVWGTFPGLYADVDGHESMITDANAVLDSPRFDGGPASLAVTPDGEAIVAFTTHAQGQRRRSVWIAQREPGSLEFRAARRVGATAGTDPMVVSGAGGDAMVLWSDRGEIRAVTQRGARGTFGAPQTLARGHDLSGVGAAIGRDGRAIVAWSDEGRTRAIQRPAGAGEFDDPVTLLRAGGLGGDVSVAIAGSGPASIVWANRRRQDGHDRDVVVSVSWSPRSRPGAPRQVTADGLAPMVGPFALATRSETVTVFTPDNGYDGKARWLAVTPDGRTAILADPGHLVVNPLFAAGPSGLVAAWFPEDGNFSAWLSRLREIPPRVRLSDQFVT